MKNIRSLIHRSFLILGVAYSLAGCVASKDNLRNTNTMNIKSQLDNKSWAFVAQSALPMAGRTIQLNGYNELVVKNDSMQSYLPYFGRAYSAPMSPSEGGYNFSALIKTYAISDHKNGYDVVLSPQDRSNGEKFNLSVFDNGTAMLTVSNNNRQPISFNGYLRTIK
jgi:hypothetical protein